MQTNNMAPISKSLFFILIGVYLIVFIVSAFRLVKYNNQSVAKHQNLKTKYLEAQLQLKDQEVSYLKMQIHPHFLFNTLNTLYGFALKKSDDTPDLILKLSNLLDYLLYQTDKPSVNLESEIKHITDYLELEKVRFKDTLNLTFNCQKDYRDLQIAPMIIIPFVENAFKHGKILNGFLSIIININVIDNTLLFSIKNTSEQKENTNEKSGIGLKNIRKRLDLLYQDKYDLIISNEKNWFSADLTLDTSTKPSNYEQKSNMHNS